MIYQLVSTEDSTRTPAVSATSPADVVKQLQLLVPAENHDKILVLVLVDQNSADFSQCPLFTVTNFIAIFNRSSSEAVS